MVRRNINASLLLVLLGAVNAFGAATGLPWEVPMTKVEQSLSGPVMLSLGVIVIVAISVMIAWRGEILEIFRHSSATILALGLGFGALVAVTALFVGSAGAVV